MEMGRESRIHHCLPRLREPSQADGDSSPHLGSRVSDRETEAAIHSLGEATIPELRDTL